MSYHNPKIPEGINVSTEHPLKELFVLGAGALALIVGVVLVLSLSAGYLSKFIPFKAEQKLAAKVNFGEHFSSTTNGPVRAYLQDLVNHLAEHQGLDRNMPITVHYVEDEMVNALATLGGNIFIFSGLLEQLPHENALSMVLAHEIAHVKHRDPILALGRGLTVMLAMASISGFSDSGVFDGLLGQAGTVTLLSFNRSQEEQADTTALLTLESYYGHTDGAAALFEILSHAEEDSTEPEFLRSHPLTDKRIAAIKAYQQSNSKPTHQLTAFPDFLSMINNSVDQEEDKTPLNKLKELLQQAN